MLVYVSWLERALEQACGLLGAWKDHTVNCQVHQLNHKEDRYVCKCGLEDARAFLAEIHTPQTTGDANGK